MQPQQMSSTSDVRLIMDPTRLSTASRASTYYTAIAELPRRRPPPPEKRPFCDITIFLFASFVILMDVMGLAYFVYFFLINPQFN